MSLNLQSVPLNANFLINFQLIFSSQKCANDY